MKTAIAPPRITRPPARHLARKSFAQYPASRDTTATATLSGTGDNTTWNASGLFSRKKRGAHITKGVRTPAKTAAPAPASSAPAFSWSRRKYPMKYTRHGRANTTRVHARSPPSAPSVTIAAGVFRSRHRAHRQRYRTQSSASLVRSLRTATSQRYAGDVANSAKGCLLYTSDAADDLLCVDLGGR